MWAQNWLGVVSIATPYPNETQLNITDVLVKKNFTILKMFDIANEFYMSLGLEDNEMSYNTTRGAMIQKPKDGRNVVCHASAWDFCNGKDFRY